MDTKTNKPRRGPGRPIRTEDPVLSDTEFLDVAFDMFAEFGYDGTSLRAVGKRLGVSHNLMSARFGSKADCWKQAVARRVALRVPMVLNVFNESFDSERSRLKMLIQRYVELSCTDGSLANLVAIEARQNTWRTSYLIEHHIRHYYESLQQLLRRVSEESGTRPIPAGPFMMLMVQGIGAYFGSRPLLRQLDDDATCDKLTTAEHTELFAGILLPRVLGPGQKKSLRR